MINDDIFELLHHHVFADIIFRDATLREPEAVNLACMHPRSKVQVLAADNPSPRARDTDTDKLQSLELVNLDYHPHHTAVADARRWKIVEASGRANRRAGPTKLRSIYCVFSKVRSKADCRLPESPDLMHSIHPEVGAMWTNLSRPAKGKN